MPITSLRLEHTVSDKRVSSGVKELDAMMDNKGFYSGSTVLVSGTPGTGKSSLAVHFAQAACNRGERVLYFAYEESSSQIIRNMRSIGIDLEPCIEKGLLKFHATRPTFYGLEMHLAIMHKQIIDFKPDVVIVDPINSFVTRDNELEAKAISVKLIDFLKTHQITSFFTSLTSTETIEHTNIFISSLIDSWLLLTDMELNGERNRGLYILKSRGMAHSNQIREFLITDNGIKLKEVYSGLNGVLTGSARIAQELRENQEKLRFEQEIKRKRLALERKRKSVEAEIASIRTEFEAAEKEMLGEISIDESVIRNDINAIKEMAKRRNIK